MQAATALSIEPDTAVVAAALSRRQMLRQAKHLWPHDLPTYAREGLIIRPKDPVSGALGALQPLDFNGVQVAFDGEIDNQLAEREMVRAIVLKARQLGITTYVAARFYWKVRYTPGLRALIMCHREDAVKNILGMFKRFREHDPMPLQITRDNDTELMFENDSGFVVAVAGAVSTGAGRSFTYQLAHLSELAFWQNASDHLTAVLDAVPDAPGSEIIFESTANGAAGPFYTMSMAAQKGQGRYQLIFLPWFLHEEYRSEPPADWAPGPSVEGFTRFGLSRERCTGRRRRTLIAPRSMATTRMCFRGALSRSTRAPSTRRSVPGARAGTSPLRWWRQPGAG